MEQINNIKKTVAAFFQLQELNAKEFKNKDILEEHDKVLLEVTFKKMPLNREPYVDVIGPLAAPTNSWSNLSVCLFVRDINQSRKQQKDRELDLNQTKNHYKQLLTDAGVPESLMKNICLMPVRELITEYNNFQAKNKLAASFDIFLVDSTLYNNKFKFLRSFLGSAFTERTKKCPIPVNLKESDKIKKNILVGVRSTNLYISGFGQTCTILIGRKSFDQITLAKNLKLTLARIQRKYDSLISTLKLCDESLHGITFFADLRKLQTQTFAERFPLRPAKRVRVPVAAQFKGEPVEEEISDTEIETEGGKYELKQKKVRYEDISIF